MAIIEIQTLDEIDQGSVFVLIDEDPRYPDQLLVQTIDQDNLLYSYPEYISPYSVLIETGMWNSFSQRLTEDGWTVYVMPEAQRVVQKFEEWSKPLVVANYKLPNKPDGSPGALHPYQQYGLNKAMSSPNGFFFFNWGTGAGKGVAATAGAQELINQDKIDLVYVFTMRKMKINLMREFLTKTNLTARVIDGKTYQKNKKKYSAKQDRAEQFAKQDAQVYVMNYEKAREDYEILEKRAKGKRVLFIFDEVQKILTYTQGKPNLAGAGIRDLIRSVKKPYVWPMSATVIGRDPERFWHLFNLPVGANKLGLLSEFRSDYAPGEPQLGTSVWNREPVYEWQPELLEEVRHRIAPWTHSVRKSDPGVREFFKSTEFTILPVQLSDEDQKLYRLVEELGAEDPDNWGQYYRVLRYICNTAEGLHHSGSEVAQAISGAFPSLSTKTSAKMEALVNKVEEIRDSGEKVIVFSQFTNMGIFRIAEEFDRRGITYVLHYGTGMSDKQAQKAQDDFRANPDITVFLSSHAGGAGLSFERVKSVIVYELPYDYDITQQLLGRNDRANSELDIMTNYAFVCDGTVEERIRGINENRMLISSAIQGTTEEYSRLTEEEFMGQLVFSGSQ